MNADALSTMSSSDTLFDALSRVHSVLDSHGIWHVLAYGTLLGAIREGDILPWDDDFDMLVRPEDLQALAGCGDDLAAEGLHLVRIRRPADRLALRPPRIRSFDSALISVYAGTRRVGDLFLFSLFSDGVLRRYDFRNEIYWSPHASFPHFFVEERAEGTLRGKPFPVIAHAESWLASVYGEDWRTPRRSVNTGGAPQADRNIYGQRIAPRLAEDIAWCEARGWDRSRYKGAHPWPRVPRGAGPLGPTERTKDNSRSLWWRDVEELVQHF